MPLCLLGLLLSAIDTMILPKSRLSDGAGSNYGGFGRNQRRGGGPRRERDDKVHDSIIEERIQREKPCRTLFIRNIKASVHSAHLRDRAAPSLRRSYSLRQPREFDADTMLFIVRDK